MALLTALLILFGIAAVASAQGVREIEIHAEKVGDVVHWMPEQVEVVPGETVLFVLNHKLEGGFDFHGIAIDPDLPAGLPGAAPPSRAGGRRPPRGGARRRDAASVSWRGRRTAFSTPDASCPPKTAIRQQLEFSASCLSCWILFLT